MNRREEKKPMNKIFNGFFLFFLFCDYTLVAFMMSVCVFAYFSFACCFFFFYSLVIKGNNKKKQSCISKGLIKINYLNSFKIFNRIFIYWIINLNCIEFNLHFVIKIKQLPAFLKTGSRAFCKQYNKIVHIIYVLFYLNEF